MCCLVMSIWWYARQVSTRILSLFGVLSIGINRIGQRSLHSLLLSVFAFGKDYSALLLRELQSLSAMMGPLSISKNITSNSPEICSRNATCGRGL